MRSPTDPAKIHSFMAALGRSVGGPGRVYLTGGATALLLGWRDSTIDVDVKADPEPKGFFEALASIKDALDVNIELASPDQFIPELSGWRDRSQFIAKHGPVEFYHCDFYSQALAKIERGHSRDLADVAAMFQRDLISRSGVWEKFIALEAGLIRYPAISPAVFRESVARVCGKASSAS